MVTKTLYLAWQNEPADNVNADNPSWFPVGRLDVDIGESQYHRFRYTKGAEEAKVKAGFSPLPEFPDFEKDYESSVLFPLFQNRIISRRRPDFAEYLRVLALDEDADQIDILSANGGKRATDSFDVFPEPVNGADGSFTCRFFLPGGIHVNQDVGASIDDLEAGERLKVSLGGKVAAGTMRLRLQTEEGREVGWAPQYLTYDLMLDAESLGECEASVVQVNPAPAPSRQRVLIELTGNPGGYEPMSGENFRPLVD